VTTLPREEVVGYIGWTGHGNLGDEAMFSAIRQLLPRVSLQPFERNTRRRLFSTAPIAGGSRFSAVVLGGGTLINRGYLPIAEAALSLGVDVSSFGTGVGSCGFAGRVDEDISAWAPLLRRFKRIGVRGPRSAEALRRIGIERVEVVGDPALALTLDRPQPPPTDGAYALNVAMPDASHPAFPSALVMAEIARAVSRLERLGLHAIPIALCEEDIGPTTQALSEVRGGHEPVALASNPMELFQLLKRCRFLLGVRLHAAVLACCAGVPPISIGYRDKCADFMDSMNLMEWHIDAYSMAPGDLVDLTSRMVDAADGCRPTIAARAASWRDRLRSHGRAVCALSPSSRRTTRA
jgi:polysaccharide pyruvyl transferase WcaK-like protein